MKSHCWAIILILLLTFLTYANSFKNEFVYDDHRLIVENEFIKSPKNLSKIFSRDYFFLAREKSSRPLWTLSFFLDYSLWKLNVFGWHLTNNPNFPEPYLNLMKIYLKKEMYEEIKDLAKKMENLKRPELKKMLTHIGEGK